MRPKSYFLAMLALAAGCAGAPEPAPVRDTLTQAPAVAPAALPSCATAALPRAGAVTIEERTGSNELVVRIAGAPVCAGSIPEIDLLLADPGFSLASSDPMPADPGESDPMPARPARTRAIQIVTAR